METMTIFSVEFLELQIVTFNLDASDPAFLYAEGREKPILPTSFSDLELSVNKLKFRSPSASDASFAERISLTIR